ncbi:RNA polymerase sigma factor [Planctomycetota bacterium]
MQKKRKNLEFTEHSGDFAHLNSEWTKSEQKDEHLETSLKSLQERLKAGDNAVAAELVDLFYKQMFLYFRRLGHSTDVSEDLTQVCFIKAWQHIGQLKNSNALKSWMYHIASNTSKLYWRRHKDNTENLENFDIADDGLASHDQIENLEQLIKLKKAVAALPFKFRQTIVLHYMHHLTIAQSAQAAGIRKGTFKSRLSRALKRLKDIFSDQQVEIK